MNTSPASWQRKIPEASSISTSQDASYRTADHTRKLTFDKCFIVLDFASQFFKERECAFAGVGFADYQVAKSVRGDCTLSRI